MDYNSYSYVNTSGKSNIIAETESGLSGYPVFFEFCINWFNEKYYYVHDLFGYCKEFTFSFLDTDSERKAYTAAAQYYNTLVNDFDAIPIF